MGEPARRRTAASRVRRLLDGSPGVTPRQALSAAAAVTRLAVDQLVNDRALFEEALDRVDAWVRGAVGADEVRWTRRDVVAAATRADGEDDRGAWLAMEAVVSLVDAVLEEDPWAVGPRGWRAVTCAAESMAWPDVDVDDIVAAVDERLHEALDRAGAPTGDETRAAPPRRAV